MKESYFVYFFLDRLIQNSKTCRKKEKLMLNGKSVCSSMLPVVVDLAKDKNRHLSRHGVNQLNKLISAPRKTDRRICSGKLSFVTVDIILAMYLYFIILFWIDMLRNLCDRSFFIFVSYQVSDNHSLSSVKSILSVAADTETSRPTLIATSGNKEAIRPSEVKFCQFNSILIYLLLLISDRLNSLS